LGIAEGIQQLGLSLGPLALRYFLVGILIILLRGIVTEWITAYMIRREKLKKANASQAETQTSV
jgi:PTS system glucitol/sorbitol-specific IIC component